MSAATSWAAWRIRGPEQLAVTLGVFLAGFFLLPNGKALNNVYYLLVFTPALFLLRLSDWRWLATSHLWKVAMLLLFYLTMSGLWSSAANIGDWLHEAKALPYITVYLAVLACICVRRRAGWECVVRVFVLAAVVGTLVSVTLFYRTVSWPARLEYYGAVYNPNEAATLVGGCLILVLFQILPTAHGAWRQAVWLAAALVLMIGIVLTGSRSPLAATMVCVGLGLALMRKWRLLGLAAVVLGLTISILLASGYDYREALARGDSYRTAIWRQCAARIAERPWLGEGILTDDSTQVGSKVNRGLSLSMAHPHNVYLATTLYGGLPALAILITLVILALRQGIAVAHRGEPAWLLMLIVGLLCMLTDGDRLLHAPRGIWFYFWMPVGVLVAGEAQAAALARRVQRELGP
ncbi:MAG: O-antigen ligase family protein [Immundisolibacter sp.]|uniref:O-antigen ligase family protein n=1 Tax=Immundisolibacter sp. TaxID=1934948 RepID=UPI003EE30EDD